MIVFALCLSLVSGAPSALRSALESPTGLSALFTAQMESFGKHYTADQMKFRLLVFRENLQEVVTCNEEEAYSCGLNRFSDLTGQEKKRFLGLKNMTDSYEPRTSPRPQGLRAASSVDWREHGVLTEVKDQGDCGSGYIFSAAGSLAAAYQIATGTLVDFSEQELLDCTYNAIYDDYDVCEGGWYYDSWDYVMRSRHLASNADVPYTGRHSRTCNKDTTNSLTYGSIHHYVEVTVGDDNLANAISINPVSVAMIFEGTAFHYKSGVYDGLNDCECELSNTEHALVAVGFTPDTFLLKNSWGASWGDKGYMTITRGTNVCRVSDFVYYPVIRKSGEPTEEPPTLVPTPDPTCRDSHPMCPAWQSWGQCSGNPGYMLERCALSCHQCVCGDNNKNCKKWAAEGDCRTNTKYMLVHCKQACNICEGEPTSEPTPTPTLEPRPTPNPECKDKRSSCPVRAAQGECGTGKGYKKTLEECPDSCHQCSCGDNDKNCKPWVEHGSDCKSNFMKQNCRKSCKFCSPEACVDKDDNCPRLAEQGKCVTQQPWTEIFKRCPRSCHRCVCGDNYKDCKEFAARGDCVKSPGWMGVQCRKSCQLCY